ncbi:ParB-like nuclease domain protein [Paraliobacillus sp. PM-2]|uniref:ParB/RepB/Spo0J family partition protein n=1 Tax=Paraliobacillus sp. PM-2 TaxID=1462524 RepID=UPI00061CB6CD|nr:ParB/RepB/Spo0J family partition protein [Paraliobacillus sp. PM-2]CQR46593.1 ParB-like nuclease domain protein [Paraliobacillus sp. PM-2]
MGTIEVRLEQIVLDLESRINSDTEGLKKSIQKYGLITPLTVFGPDKNNNYYLIKGYRRYDVLKELSVSNHEYKEVPVNIISKKIDTKLERQTLRFHLNNTSKKTNGAEEQSAIDYIQNTGNYSDEELIEIAQPKPARVKRMKKSREIDKNLRHEIAKKRGSQHALEVIVNMPIPKKQFSRLYNLLLNRKITGIDADALKKLDKDELFDDLSDQQKSSAIKKVLAQSRFTDREARLIILAELMKDKSTDYSENSFELINYLARSLGDLTEMIHPDIRSDATDIQREQLRSGISGLTNSLSWTWKQEYKENDSNQQFYRTQIDELTSEETTKGYRFRLH